MGLKNVDIEERIAGALLALKLLFPAGLAEKVVAAYESPGRHYHSPGHIRACLAVADEFDPRDPMVTLAVCYHDVVYDTRSTDNERLSAEWAVHEDDEKMVAAADLSVLGSPADDYDCYVRAVRQEYGWMEEADFRAGGRTSCGACLPGQAFSRPTG